MSPKPGPIELAPRHKLGLTVPNPVLLAAGVIGYGDAKAPHVDLGRLGGFVTAPVSRRAWHGELPTLTEVPGGILWSRGPWNPGVRRVVRDYQSLWQRILVPVIVHIAGADASQMAAAAAPLEELEGVAGLELDAPPQPDRAAALVWAVREVADLPLLVRVPLFASDEVITAILEAGADALVIAQPPTGRHPALNGSPTHPRGDFHGPGATSLIVEQLALAAAWVDVPLLACGGIHSLDDAQRCLVAGASAIQIDTALWVDPTLANRLADSLAHPSTG